MGSLRIFNHNGINVTDSIEVAEVTGKQHRDLLQSIRGYINHLECGNFRSQDFFIESTYINTQNKEQPCFLLTRKGCDMVANKMTGERGVLFTAAYVTKFEEMEGSLKKSIDTEQLSTELQMFNQLFQALAKSELAQQKLQLEVNAAKEEAVTVKQEVRAMREVINLNPNQWRSDVSSILSKIAMKLGGSSEDYKRTKEESYELLDARAGAKLCIRLTNRRRKVLEETGSRSKSEKVTKLDCIAEDKRLTEVYLAIVKEMAIKYKIA